MPRKRKATPGGLRQFIEEEMASQQPPNEDELLSVDHLETVLTRLHQNQTPQVILTTRKPNVLLKIHGRDQYWEMELPPESARAIGHELIILANALTKTRPVKEDDSHAE